MQRDFLELTIAYAHRLEEEVEAILADSETLGSQILDVATITTYEAEQPEWELSDHAALLEKLAEESEGPVAEEEMQQRIYFPDTEEGRANLERMKQRFWEQFAGEVRVLGESEIDNGNWAEEWKKYYEPLSVGETMEIVPSWMEPTDPSRLPIFIDPGMAFGTGTHETTYLCLEALEKLDLKGKSGIDLGTGSGILAIYMKKAGMAHVEATDLEEDALEAARKNASLNDVELDIHASDLLDGVTSRADVLCANLLADLVIRMIPAADAHLNPGGRLILSGILTSRAADVTGVLKEEGYAVLRQAEAGEWTVLEAERRS